MHQYIDMVAIHWLDTKGVLFLSTSANPVQRYGLQVRRNSGGQSRSIPSSLVQVEYSKYMHSVDTQDQLRGSYSTQIFTKRWWHRVYFFLLDTALTNAFIMHKHLCGTAGLKCYDHKSFQLKVAHTLMASKCGRTVRSSTVSTSENAGGHISFQVSKEGQPASAEAVPEGDDVILSQESVVSGVTIPGTAGISGQHSGRGGSAMRRKHGTTTIQERSTRGGRYGRPCKSHAVGESALRKQHFHMACVNSKGALRRRYTTCKVRTKWKCKGCYDEAVCPGQCFIVFHSRK